MVGGEANEGEERREELHGQSAREDPDAHQYIEPRAHVMLFLDAWLGVPRLTINQATMLITAIQHEAAQPVPVSDKKTPRRSVASKHRKKALDSSIGFLHDLFGTRSLC